MDNIILELKNIKKSFGDTEILKDISININKGEFITLLGSSGCGKTTTIRIIAGLENMDSGEIILNGKVINNLEANKRDINTIFQNYALFPNMNVKDNVAYGLKIKKISKDIIEKEVKEVLKLVQLEGFEKRMPNSLSGGQKQRVAIARAIINKPSVLLLDEPLGALDLKLRRQMQTELKNLQQKLGITFIYITHDQEEAINMSDRIVVMNKGEFEQIGTPNEIYYKPKTSYVATFVGNCNIYKENNKYYAIRPEHIYLSSMGKKAEVIAKSFVSGQSKITCRLEDNQILNFSNIGMDKEIEINSNINIDWSKENQVEVVYNGE